MEKTCGNCGHWHHMKNNCGACLESYSGALSQEVTIAGRSESCLIVPNSWVPKTTDTLEQRYQRLAEVARDMLKFLKNIEREYPRLLDPNRKPGGQILYPMPSDEYANQLEELGVEL